MTSPVTVHGEGPPDGADARGARLLGHLRGVLEQPELEFAEPPSPVSGGFATRIFAFRVRGAEAAWSGPLILGVLTRETDPLRVLRERAVQNAVAALGYPAPRVVDACTDPAVLGGAFLVMERLPGRVLPEERMIGMAAVLVEQQRRLHALDAEPLLQALDVETPVGRAAVTFDGYLADLSRRTLAPALSGLRPGSRWLVEHRPREDARPVICHGDFHPLNILVESSRVTGVLDWPNTIVADGAYDGAQGARHADDPRVCAGRAGQVSGGGALAGACRARAGGPPLCRGLSGWRRAGRRQAVLLRGCCLHARARPGGRDPCAPETSAFTAALLARVSRLTGLTPTLPAARP